MESVFINNQRLNENKKTSGFIVLFIPATLCSLLTETFCCARQFFNIEVYEAYSNTCSTTRLIVGLSSSYHLFVSVASLVSSKKNWNSQSVPTLEFKSNSTQLKKSHLLPKAKRKLALYISRGRWRQNMSIGFKIIDSFFNRKKQQKLVVAEIKSNTDYTDQKCKDTRS